MADQEAGNRSVPPSSSDGSPPPILGKVGSLIVRVFAIGFGAFWLSGVGAIFFSIASQLHRELRRAYTYEPVAAVVSRYTPAKAAEGEDESAPARIEYRYVVAGTPYQDEYSCPGGMRAIDEYEPALERSFAPGEQVTAYYDPEKPSESTLNPAAQPFFLGFLIFISPFLAVGVGMIWMGLFGDPDRIRILPGRKGGLRASGGGAYLGAYSILSAVAAFAFFLACTFLYWRTAFIVGAGLWLGGVPAATLTVVRLGKALAARRRPAAPAPAPEGLVRPAPFLPKTSRRFAGMVLMTLFWCGITGAGMAFVAWSLLKARDVRARFQTAPGVVLSSSVKTHSGEDGTTYEAIVRYRYTVNGREHVSDRYAFGMTFASDRGHAAGIVAEFSEGKRITVYYDPDEPGESVLTLEAPGFYYLLGLFLQPFVLVGLFLIGWTASLPGRARRVREFLESRMQVPCRIPTWGELRHEMGGFAIRGGSRLKMVLGGLAGGYAATCFIGAVLAALLSRSFSDPDPRLVRAVFIAAPGVGVLFSLLVWVRPVGKARLHIDTALGRLSLTSRKRKVELSLSEVGAWTVRPIPNPDLVEGREQAVEAPLLALATAGGEQVPIHVFKADAEGKALAQKAAEGFAELTGKAVNVVAEPAIAGVPAKINIGDVVALVRESRRAAKEYDDLT